MALGLPLSMGDSPGIEVQRLSMLILPFLLAACVGLPPQLALVTQAADGVSYVFTGKSGTDHLFSAAMKKDCALARAVQGQAICRAKKGSSKFAQALSQVEGGHPGAALDHPIEHDELVALDPVLLPQEMAGLAPALGGAARLPRTPAMGPSAFADPKRLISVPRLSPPVSRPDAANSVSVGVSIGEKLPPAPAVKPKASPPKIPQPRATRIPMANPSYYVVVGTYRNWVAALENAGRQSQGVASVVTAHENGGKTHRVLIGPFDQRSARDTQRLVGRGGYRSAWLVRSCSDGPAVSGLDQVRGQTCMDLGRTWR